MLSKVRVSAPGKLMLLGEHSVVYGYPCLTTSIGERMFVTIESLQESLLKLDVPDLGIVGYIKKLEELGKGEIPKTVQFVELAVQNFYDRFPEFRAFNSGNQIKGVNISTRSNFSRKYGFGSSSAVTVGVIKGLVELYSSSEPAVAGESRSQEDGSRLRVETSTLRSNNKLLFDLAYKTVLEIQGKASGFDVATAIYGGTLYFVGGGKTIEPLPIQKLPLLIGYSGEKGDTVGLIEQVAKKQRESPHIVGKIFTAISELVEKSKTAMLENDWERLGTYMNFNQDYLRDLGVSTQKLEDMILAAKKAGAWGAKLSGAGGGDCMIALVSQDKREVVKKAIMKVGGEVVEVETGVEGVRIEPS